MLSDMNFLDRLQNYDKDHISPDVTRKIRENYLTNDDFTPEKVTKNIQCDFTNRAPATIPYLCYR